MAGVVSRQGGRAAATLFFCLFLTACATGPQWRALDDSLDRRAVLLEHVPFHSQRDFQCGPAALAMALNAAGVPVTVDDMIPQVYLPAREGSLQPEMLAATRRNGRISYVIDATPGALLAEIQAGKPVVVLQNLSLPWWPMWHYAVVIGYDLDQQELILHTGERAASRVGLRRFDNTWARSDRWAMVALPPGELPAAITPLAAAEAISAFERSAAPGVSITTWLAYTERWPDRALGWFGFGNARYAAGDFPGAARAFMAATERDASYGPAWVNLGFVLEELGDQAGARAAFTNAAELDGPWRETAHSALQRLRTGQPPP